MRSSPPVPAGQETDGRTRVLSQNLLALGFTSFFTDISSEMVVHVLPLYLTTALGFSVFGYSIFQAAYEGISAIFRIWGGSIADHRQSHKKTAAIGYSISTATRFGLVAGTLAGATTPALIFVLIDRVGKGLRTAPRDALISLSTAPNRLAMAFGVHRAMDTAGALLGPVVAFLVLSAAPGAFDAVFVVSAIFGVIGAGVIWLFAQEKPQAKPVVTARRPLLDQWRQVLASPGVRPIAFAVAPLAMATVGDGFIFLAIFKTSQNFQGSGLNARYFPLLAAGTAVTYLVLAVPFGRLADRIGTRPVFLSGHAFLIAVYLILAFSELDLWITLLCLGIHGAYFAATDGVIAAMVSQRVDAHIRASGIAFVTMLTAVSRMLSALIFGLLWTSLGQTQAFVIYAIALGVVLVVATRVLSVAPQRTNDY